jgi:hypothetical protein
MSSPGISILKFGGRFRTESCFQDGTTGRKIKNFDTSITLNSGDVMSLGF